jgi:hypothetical protein
MNIQYKGHIHCAGNNGTMDFSPHEAGMIDSFRNVWDGLPGSIVDVQNSEDAGKDGGVDAVIMVQINDTSIVLVAEIKRQVFPRDVREIYWQLNRSFAGKFGRDGEREYIPFIMADAISPGARDDMRRDGIGYFEGGGSLFIPSKAAYLLIDKPMEKGGQAKAMTTVFEGQRAMVLHAIWEAQAGEPWFSVKEIVESSGASAGTVSETLNELERREWVDAVGSGPSKLRRLSDPSGLLDEWKAYQLTQKPPKMTRYYIPSAKLDEIVSQLASAPFDYEITGEVAGQKYAPYLTKVSTLVCRHNPGLFLDGFLTKLKAKLVTEGWNFGLFTAGNTIRQLRFRQTIDGVQYASPLQTYLDLLQGPGRSKDLAEHLREQKLKR